jgi:hypothetical protein
MVFHRLPRIIPLAVTYLIPLAHLVSSGPFDPELWGLDIFEEEIPSGPDWWDDGLTDPTDVSLFGPEFEGSTSEYGIDLLAGNDPCRAEADDLWGSDWYSKVRRRQACDANTDLQLGLPSLFRLTGSDEDTIKFQGPKKDLEPPPPPVAPAVGGDDSLCPSDVTFFSKIPVCDSGNVKDIVTSFGSATLKNVTPCWFPPTLSGNKSLAMGWIDAKWQADFGQCHHLNDPGDPGDPNRPFRISALWCCQTVEEEVCTKFMCCTCSSPGNHETSTDIEILTGHDPNQVNPLHQEDRKQPPTIHVGYICYEPRGLRGFDWGI